MDEFKIGMYIYISLLCQFVSLSIVVAFIYFLFWMGFAASKCMVMSVHLTVDLYESMLIV